MHTAYSNQFRPSLLLTPTETIQDPPLDSLPHPSGNKSLPLNIHTPHRDDDGLPTTSQSWPPPSDCPSFGAAGEKLEFNQPPGDGPVRPPPAADVMWSPAAAFLSSFASSPPAPPDETIAGYVLGPTIGHGGFSTIKEATSLSGGVVAVKIVRLSAFAALSPREKAWQRSRLFHEARVWASLSHENILPLFDSYRTAEATYLITLYCPAGSLLDILRREGTPALEQTDAGCMFRQVVKALQYLHETVGLVHGDVKLENVLVDESGVCRLTDFGLTRRIGAGTSQVSSDDEDADNPDRPHSRRDRSRVRRTGTSALPVHLSLVRNGPPRHRNSTPRGESRTPPTHPDHMFQPGSLPYAAPELLLPHSHSNESIHKHADGPTASPAQDMWALGVLLYGLLTGSLPFRDAFEPRLQMKILRAAYDMPPAIGPLAESVLKGCLKRDVSTRWTIAMVDNAAWGIGYGNVDLDPEIREEQRSQSQPRSHASSPSHPSFPARARPSLSPSPSRDLQPSMSSWSLTSCPPVHPPAPRGRIALRSQSRSPSPSVAPRTPEDEGATFFGRRRPRRDEDDVQIVLEGEWDARDRVFDEEGASGEAEAGGSEEDRGDKWPRRRRDEDVSEHAPGFDYD